jgi:hypothetical protein
MQMRLESGASRRGTAFALPLLMTFVRIAHNGAEALAMVVDLAACDLLRHSVAAILGAPRE